MTHPIHDHDDILNDLIDAEATRSIESDCPTEGHSWRPTSGGRLRCARCHHQPHRPVQEATR